MTGFSFITVYFNPRPPRGGGDGIDGAAVQVDQISIHAPREGGDHIISSYPVKTFISIHAPREGGDQT